jgi:ribose transport system permease protein
MDATVQNQEELDKQARIKKAVIRDRIISFIPIIGLVVLAAIFFVICAVTKADILTNLEVVIRKALIVGFLATGASFIFAIGSFDLSLGANLVVSAVIGAFVYTKTGSLTLMLILCVVISTAISLFNSTLASFFRLPVFIMTIAMMSLLSALAALLISKISPTGIDTKLSRSSNADFAIYNVLNNIWFQFAMLVVFVAVCVFIFDYLKLGRQQKFLGGNPVCAKLTGISSLKMTLVSFALAGVGIGLAAFFSIIQSVKVTTATASGIGMNMLIAIVFGGMSLNGGPGTKSTAAFIGGFSMAFMDQFMTLLSIQNGDAVKQIVKAVLFLVIVTMLSLANRKGLLKR